MHADHVARILDAHGADLSWQEATYRHLHAHPELSAMEEATAATILERLRAIGGYEIHEGVGGHGVVAVLRNGEGPSALFRADIDALPVAEATGAEYASTARGRSREGQESAVMHACGHDLHIVAGLGAAAIMAATRRRWSGTYIALFQPAEETASGARAMVEDGLAGIVGRPDACFGQHVVPGPAGQVRSAAGPVLAGCDTISIDLRGRAAHGSMPQTSVDPTYLAAAIVLRLQGIVGREISPHDFAVVSVGTLASGHSNNTIPGTARIVLSIRFYDPAVRETLIAAIERVVRGECAASGAAEPVFGYSDHGEVTDNDPGLYARVRPVFDRVLGEDSADCSPWTASEDFSDIPRALGSPYVYWLVGATPRAQWAAAAAAGRELEDVPANHMATFLPDYAPTAASATTAAAAAALGVLDAR